MKDQYRKEIAWWFAELGSEDELGKCTMRDQEAQEYEDVFLYAATM